MSPATREDLQEIHRLLTEAFFRYLQETPRENQRASMFEVIRSFLRDNGITKDLNLHKDVQTSLVSLASLDIPFFSN